MYNTVQPLINFSNDKYKHYKVSYSLIYLCLKISFLRKKRNPFPIEMQWNLYLKGVETQ